MRQQRTMDMPAVVTYLLLAAIVNGLLQPRPRFNQQKSNGKLALTMASYKVDVAVIGAGIGGSTISWLLQEQHSCSVALIDPRVNKPGSFYPNYGAWRNEWHCLSERLKLPELKECTTTEWEYTDCFFGGSDDIPTNERLTLPNPYVRVDRIKLQSVLRDKYKAAGGVQIASKLVAKQISSNLFDQNLVHTSEGSELILENGDRVTCKVVIDASGSESQLVEKEDPMLARGSEKILSTGYQIAYGFIALIDSLQSYDPKAMTLFDYRTDPFMADSTWLKDTENKPTFMYVMPLEIFPNGTHRVFFEETSLVGRDERRLTFAECKKRAFHRLSHLGMKVFGVEEEEYCYIPMGGELPDLNQRVVAFAGAANTVHPATGYQACRMMASATDVATVIGSGIARNLKPDVIAGQSYRAIWSQQNRNQRDFQSYGSDFLMEQNVDILRGFFQAFFELEGPVWGGFLAGWPGLPGNIHHESWNRRLVFALSLFLKMNNKVRLTMMLYAVRYTIEYGPGTLLRSLTPGILFGAGPPDYQSAEELGLSAQETAAAVGDEAAKQEARQMMKEFIPSAGNHHTHSNDNNDNTKELVSVGSSSSSSTPSTDTISNLPAPFN